MSHTVRPDVCFQLKLQYQHDQQKSLQWPPVTGIVFCPWRGGLVCASTGWHDANVPGQTKDSFYYWVTKQRLQQWLYKIKENMQLKGRGEKMQVSCWGMCGYTLTLKLLLTNINCNAINACSNTTTKISVKFPMIIYYGSLVFLPHNKRK